VARDRLDRRTHVLDFTGDERQRRYRDRLRERGYVRVSLYLTPEEENRVRSLLERLRRDDPDAPWAWGKLKPRPRA